MKSQLEEKWKSLQLWGILDIGEHNFWSLHTLVMKTKIWPTDLDFLGAAKQEVLCRLEEMVQGKWLGQQL